MPPVVPLWHTDEMATRSKQSTDHAHFTPAAMQVMLGKAAEAVETPPAVLLRQDAEMASWWELSMDEGLTWGFFCSRSTSPEMLLERFRTVVSGHWDHATDDDWMDEEDDREWLDDDERTEEGRSERLSEDQERYLETVAEDAAIAPSIATLNGDSPQTDTTHARKLLELQDQLQERLATGETFTQEFLQSVWDVSGETRAQVPSYVYDAMMGVEDAMCPFYSGFVWVGCDGPTLIRQRLELCTRRSRVVLVSWLLSVSIGTILHAASTDQPLAKEAAVAEVDIQRILSMINDDPSQREWHQAAEYLRRQLRKLSRQDSDSRKQRTRVKSTAAKFLEASRKGFERFHHSE